MAHFAPFPLLIISKQYLWILLSAFKDGPKLSWTFFAKPNVNSFHQSLIAFGFKVVSFFKPWSLLLHVQLSERGQRISKLDSYFKRDRKNTQLVQQSGRTKSVTKNSA